MDNHPCETCLRWSECNGIDKQCPLIKQMEGYKVNIVKPSHELMLSNVNNPYKHIERIGRICYRSEDSITETSAEPFCSRMFNSGHHAMLEHFRFIVVVNEIDYEYLINNPHRKYLTFTHDNGRYVVSASARGFHDMYDAITYDIDNKILDAMDADIAACTRDVITDIVYNIINEYHCPMMFAEHFREHDATNVDTHIIKDFNELSDVEYHWHAWYSIHFVCDRGVTHEMVRHRDAGFAQESTRYCNYSNGKFGASIAVIDPLFFDENEERKTVDGADWPVNKYDVWKTCMENLEHAYMLLTALGAKPQEARSILPNSLKTEIVITAQAYEWKHIFNLRVLGTTGAPHPQIKEVMEPAYNEMVKEGYLK